MFFFSSFLLLLLLSGTNNCLLNFLLLFSFMGRGVVAAPVQDVAQYVGDIHTRENWDNLLVVSTIAMLRCSVKKTFFAGSAEFSCDYGN